MSKNKTEDGKSNISGRKIKEFRLNLPQKTSQKKLAEMLQLAGLEVDKNIVQLIEAGERSVTDVELKVIAKVLGVRYEDLLDYDESQADPQKTK